VILYLFNDFSKIVIRYLVEFRSMVYTLNLEAWYPIREICHIDGIFLIHVIYLIYGAYTIHMDNNLHFDKRCSL